MIVSKTSSKTFFLQLSVSSACVQSQSCKESSYNDYRCVRGRCFTRQDIYSLADFQLGYQHSEYTIGEEDGVVNNTVKIMKLNDNILQKDYQLTINVRHSDGPYTAALSKTLLLCYHTYTLT